MSSASGYYNQMMKYSKLYRDMIDKADEYSYYLEKLKNLKKNLSFISEVMVAGEAEWLNGGFVANGVGLDNGLLKKMYNLLDDIRRRINAVITNTTLKFDEFSQKKDDYYVLYMEAKSNYERAKLEQSS